jgi:hypothetical protein
MKSKKQNSDLHVRNYHHCTDLRIEKNQRILNWKAGELLLPQRFAAKERFRKEGNRNVELYSVHFAADRGRFPMDFRRCLDDGYSHLRQFRHLG